MNIAILLSLVKRHPSRDRQGAVYANLRLSLVPLALALLALALISCGGEKTAKEGAGAAPATPVQVATAEQGRIERTVAADAILFPINQANLTPKVSAPVKRFLVNRGDRVHQGELLAELENRDLIASANENKALVDQAEAQYRITLGGTMPEDLTKARTDVESARQALEADKRVYENRVALVREGALAQKLADDAKVALVQAQSLFDTAQRHLESLQTVSRQEQIKSVQSQVDAAKARYMNAEAQVQYTEIRSTIDGIVADRPSYVGEMATAGSPLISIIDPSRIVARVNVPSQDAGLVKVGSPASITGPDGEIPAKVSVVSPAVDPNSTTVEVWVQAVNKEGKLKPGTTTRVSIVEQVIPNAIIIPDTALLSSDEGENIVMVVGSDSIAHERKVEVGVRQGDKLQINEGLKPGERVVTVGGIGLEDKAKVKVESGQDGPASSTGLEPRSRSVVRASLKTSAEHE